MRRQGRDDRRRDTRGFTLPEVILAAGISSIIAMAVYSMWASSQKVFTQTTSLAQSQNDFRTGLDDLVHEVRMTGDGVPTTTTPGTLTRFWDNVTAGSVTLVTSASAITVLLDAAGASFLVNALNGGAPATSIVAGPIRTYGSPVAGSTDYLVLSGTARWDVATVRSDIPCCTADTPNNRVTVQIQSLTPAATIPAASRVSDLEMVKYYVSSNASDCRGGANYTPCVVRRAGVLRGWSGGTPDIVWGDTKSVAHRVSSLGFVYYDQTGTDITASVGSNLQNIRRVRVTMTGKVGPVGSADTRTMTLTGAAGLRNLGGAPIVGTSGSFRAMEQFDESEPKRPAAPKTSPSLRLLLFSKMP